MKKQKSFKLSALAVFGLLALTSSCVAADSSRTFCRFVPERSDDFAWENDKIAFRAYGPALRDGTENGGVDCWLKRVDYPIIDKWYKEDQEGKPYHTDHGEGYDPYHVGASLGCGGIGLWIDDELITSETFVQWKGIKNEEQESIFELSYAWSHGGHDYTLTKRMEIRLGDRLFKTTATFQKDGEIAANLPVVIGITTHEGVATASMNSNEGWLACWETIDESGLGTGVVIDPEKVEEYRLLKESVADKSHALILSSTDAKGQISWWAGYGWERAEEIKTSAEWNAYLVQFAEKVN
ncbi:MAG: DUF4861 family protein [Pontiellaceae bacterium]|nr:DUF4861 family protein [Pontiellaceae bacterium]